MARRFDTKVVMRDGISLSTDVYLPDADGGFPLIFARSPYDKNGFDGTHAEAGYYFARRGYAYAVQDVRGRYDSEGVFKPCRNEGLDGYDAIEWLATQSWCNGRVGRYHTFYLGITQLLAAPLQPPHLICVVPRRAYADMYKEWVYTGGAFAYGLNTAWMAILMNTRTHQKVYYDMQTGHPVGATGACDENYWSVPLIDTDRRTGRVNANWREWLSHPTYDDWWRQVSVEDKYGDIAVPALLIGGYYDLYTGGTPRNFIGISREGATEAARRGMKLLMGPWGHELGQDGTVTRNGDIDYGPSARFPLREWELRWLDYWLKGKNNRIATESPVKVFIMGENTWRDEQEWPLARTQFTPLYLHSLGKANTLQRDGLLSFDRPLDEPADRYTYDPLYPVPTLGGHTCSPGMVNIPAGPHDNVSVEMRTDVLVYTSAELTKDIEVAGPVIAKLVAASSARDTDWTVKLLDVSKPNAGHEVAINIADGILRARYRNSLSQPELMEPGQIYNFEIDMLVTSNLFKKGHGIRLEVSSSNFPQYDRNQNTGNALFTDVNWQSAQQTIYHDTIHPSHIVLPIIPREGANA